MPITAEKLILFQGYKVTRVSRECIDLMASLELTIILYLALG